MDIHSLNQLLTATWLVEDHEESLDSLPDDFVDSNLKSLKLTLESWLQQEEVYSTSFVAAKNVISLIALVSRGTSDPVLVTKLENLLQSNIKGIKDYAGMTQWLLSEDWSRYEDSEETGASVARELSGLQAVNRDILQSDVIENGVGKIERLLARRKFVDAQKQLFRLQFKFGRLCAARSPGYTTPTSVNRATQRNLKDADSLQSFKPKWRWNH